MRYIVLIITISLFLISCNQGTDFNRSDKINPETDKKLKKIKESVSKYIKHEWHKDSSAYKQISWGILDSLDVSGYKYKIAHQYITKTQFYTKTNILDSVVEFDITFLLDSNFQITNIVETKEYPNHYDKDGLQYQQYGSAELQKIGKVNGFDMVFFENGKKRLLLVGGENEIYHLPNSEKEKWIRANLIGAKADLLSETDTIEYCVDEIANDCEYYIFKEGKLNKIINVP